MDKHGYRAPRVDIWVQSAGLGHVTRQIVLATEILRRPEIAGSQIRFLVDRNAEIQRRIRRSGYELVVRPNNLDEAIKFILQLWQEGRPRVFIMDSVDQDRHLASAALLRDRDVLSVVIIDDASNRPVDANLVVNAFPTLNKAQQSRSTDSLYLLGVQFFILDPEFVTYHSLHRVIVEKPRQGFAFFGGADLEDFTGVFLDAIAECEGAIDWFLLIGPLNKRHMEAVQIISERHLPVTIIREVGSMAQVLFEADLAVLASGNTLVEAAAVGTPSIVFSQNSVQFENACFFAGTSGIVNLGPKQATSSKTLAQAIHDLSVDSRARSEMSYRLRAIVDGAGGQRVAAVIAANLRDKR